MPRTTPQAPSLLLTAAQPAALYVIPSPLGVATEGLHSLPQSTLERLLLLRHFVVENIKPTRRYLAAAAKKAGHTTDFIGECTFYALSEKTADAELSAWLSLLTAGTSLGLLSDAGCPGIADPGARLVAAAHRMGARVQPLTGPSSFFLALMASGMPGQQFAFHGYLPINADSRQTALIALEKDSAQNLRTQIFMDAPYRNEALLHACMRSLRPDTQLCIAADISLPTEWIVTLPIGEWKFKKNVALHKRPAVFLIYAGDV